MKKELVMIDGNTKRHIAFITSNKKYAHIQFKDSLCLKCVFSVDCGLDTLTTVKCDAFKQE